MADFEVGVEPSGGLVPRREGRAASIGRGRGESQLSRMHAKCKVPDGEKRSENLLRRPPRGRGEGLWKFKLDVMGK